MKTVNRKSKILWINLVVFVVIALVLAIANWVYPWLRTRFTRTARLVEWFRHGNEHADWAVKAGVRCGNAPLIFPTDGYIGFLWGDSFQLGHRHQGIDIFGGNAPGITPVIAAYPGYLTRLPGWKSSLIIRIPQDPHQPKRQIWMYYTHLADASGLSLIVSEFPPGTEEKYVEVGTRLGYQGNYSGDPHNPAGVHLHFSIVLDRGVDVENPLGGFLNELDIHNTLDPSPYLGISLNASQSQGKISICENEER